MEFSESALELCKYRLETAESTFRIAEVCFENQGYRDAVNMLLFMLCGQFWL